MPDRIFFIPGGKPLIIEFKAESLKPEELQSWYLKNLKAAGYTALYCDTKEKFLAVMKQQGVV